MEAMTWLIGRRVSDLVDNDDLGGAFGGLELEAEPFFKDGEE
jgi:hypothetical protein